MIIDKQIVLKNPKKGKRNPKKRSRRSRLSIASGLSTPFDVDDMEELVSDSEFDQEKEEQEKGYC